MIGNGQIMLGDYASQQVAVNANSLSQLGAPPHGSQPQLLLQASHTQGTQNSVL